MAVFAALLYSFSEEFYCLVHVFLRTGGSISDCRDYILERREEHIIEEYIRRIYHSENMSTESLDSCDFALVDDNFDQSSPKSLTIDRSSSEVVNSYYIDQITPGMNFSVNGTILLTCERFSINFMLKNGDIALHFNPRLPQNYIVRNCQTNGRWGKEEVVSPLPFNLHRGKTFFVQILITEEDFLMSVNRSHFNSFSHRLPYKKIQSLEVRGDVKDVEMNISSISKYPDLIPEQIEQISPMEVTLSKSIRTKLMPFTGRLEQPFTNGKHLHIRGRIKILPHSFYLNLQCGHYVWPHPIILFHFNPRFGKVGGKHIICRNSWTNGKWDKEERSENQTDFMPGQDFHLKISCIESAYEIYLNDKLIGEFLLRLDPKIVDTVYIQGDIKVYEVFLEAAY